MTDFELSDSVGEGATNDPEDVRALKHRLVTLGFDWLSVDETVDRELRQVIDLFQSITNGRNQVHGDGRVTVPAQSNTWMYPWLQADDAPRWQRMPAGSGDQGFINHRRTDPNNDHEYGTDWMAATIRGAGAYYRDNYLVDHPEAPPLGVNNVSLPEGGNTDSHAGHETGMACDVRLPRTDGGVGGVLVGGQAYDRDTMRAVLRALRMQPRHASVLLSDPTLADEGLCTVPRDPDVRAGHRDHAHVNLRPLFPLTGYDAPFEDLLFDAIEAFGGTLVNPVGYDATVEGLEHYLEDVGATHFSAREVVTPNHEDVARRLGYETLLPPRRWWTRVAAHVLLADELREAADEPARMRNLWRPPDYNEAVDGAEQSDHVLGLAADLDFTTVDGCKRAQWSMRALQWIHPNLGLRYITYEGSPESIHVSVLSPRGAGHVQL